MSWPDVGQRHRIQRRPGRPSENSRPAGHPGALAAQRDLDPGAAQVAVGEQRHEPTGPTTPPAAPGCRRAGERQDLHAERPPVGDELVVQPGGPSRSATVVSGIPVAQAQVPAQSQLPMCGSATTTPAPLARPGGGARHRPGAADEVLDRPRRAAGTTRTSSAGRSGPLVGQASSAASSSPGRTRARFARSRRTPSPPRGRSRRRCARRRRGRSARAASAPGASRRRTRSAAWSARRRPRRRPRSVGDHQARRGLARTDEHALHHGDGARGGEHPSVSGISTGRSKMSLKPVITEDRHQPVGALGDAALGLHAQRLGTGPGVGGHRPHHQAVQRERGQRVGLAGTDVVEHQPAEDRGVAEPVQGGVEERAPLRGGPDIRAIVPSSRSENTNAVITRTPTSSWPRGKNTSAPATTPTVPTSVTASGLTPRRRKNLAIGGEQLGPEARNRFSIARAGSG